MVLPFYPPQLNHLQVHQNLKELGCFHKKLTYFMLFDVDLCLYMSKSIAGAKYTGHFADKYVAINKLSQSPVTILAILLAVIGAITIKSAHNAKSTWLFHSLLFVSTISVKTKFSDNVDSVNGVIKDIDDLVCITLTIAPNFLNNLTNSAAL